MRRRTPFFLATRAALEAIPALFDFVWPAAVALWNLRWQVAGYNHARSKATVDELRARFVEGSGIHGANLYRACLTHTWDQQTQELARIVLVNLFATYEDWASRLVAELGHKAAKLEKALQFPSSIDKNGKVHGIAEALGALEGTESLGMVSEVQTVLNRQKTVHPAHLEEMMLIYRLFKECRNSSMHGGGLTSQAVEEAALRVAALDATKLPFPLPEYRAVAVGTPIALTLFGVVGFSDILQRTMLTIDARLSSSETAERLLMARWKATVGVKNAKRDPASRHRLVRQHLVQLGLPSLPRVAALEAMLVKVGLLR